MCAGPGKYPNESEWKLGWVRIMSQTFFVVGSAWKRQITSIVTKQARQPD